MRKPLMFRVQTTGWDQWLWRWLPLRWNLERMVKLFTYRDELPVAVPVLLDVNGSVHLYEHRASGRVVSCRLAPAEERAARNYVAGNPITEEERERLRLLLDGVAA